jgi:hypothetical protein
MLATAAEGTAAAIAAKAGLRTEEKKAGKGLAALPVVVL